MNATVKRWGVALANGLTLLVAITGNSHAADYNPTPENIKALVDAASASRISTDTIWVLVTAMLVFWMNAGFALVESGLCRAKNCVNILAKNFIVFAAASISFWIIGWGLMFGDGTPFFGTTGLLFVSGADNSPALSKVFTTTNPFASTEYQGVYSAMSWTPVPLWAKFFFQLVFAGTAATIVSGAVAERIKFSAFLMFSLLLVAFVYPITGHWIWGGGFLQEGKFRDFAGSSVVHSVGGWAALAGVLVLGPRTGKYNRDGTMNPILGHNLTSVTLGVFALWLGWFGFNPGSTMSAGNASAIAHVMVTTNMAAASGAIGAMLTSWVLLKKPDLTMILNGCLAGLVAITASCAFVSVGSAVLIGFLGGCFVVAAVLFFDARQIDDPVGALSVHLVNGIWGTLALGIFYDNKIATTVGGSATHLSRSDQFLAQLQGVLCVGVFTFVVSLALWHLIRALLTGGIRVSKEEELAGLDMGEHGNRAYPNFQKATDRANLE